MKIEWEWAATQRTRIGKFAPGWTLHEVETERERREKQHKVAQELLPQKVYVNYVGHSVAKKRLRRPKKEMNINTTRTSKKKCERTKEWRKR